MVAAFKVTDEARFPYMVHRCTAMLETAWNRLDAQSRTFNMLNVAVRELCKYDQQSTGLQEQLPKTLKRTSGTRPWRSYFSVHHSLHHSYEKLNSILRHRNEQHRLYHIDPALLNDIVCLMAESSLIFDCLNRFCTPSNVVCCST